MQYVSPSGCRPSGLFLRLSGLFFFICFAHAFAQSVTCTPTATNLVVHAEGLAEPSGTISLICTGMPGAQITANLSLNYNVPVTNRLVINQANPSGSPDAVLTINNVQTNVVPVLQGNGGSILAFNGLTFTVPASATLSINISNVRLNANAAAGRPSSPTSPLPLFR